MILLFLKWSGFHRNMFSKTIEPAKPDFSISLHTPILSLQRRKLRSRGSYVAKTMVRCLSEVKTGEIPPA